MFGIFKTTRQRIFPRDTGIWLCKCLVSFPETLVYLQSVGAELVHVRNHVLAHLQFQVVSWYLLNLVLLVKQKESVFWPNLGDDFLELEGDAGLHDARVLADCVGNPLLHT